VKRAVRSDEPAAGAAPARRLRPHPPATRSKRRPAAPQIHRPHDFDALSPPPVRRRRRTRTKLLRLIRPSLLTIPGLPLIAVSALALVLVWVAVSLVVVTFTGLLVTMILMG